MDSTEIEYSVPNEAQSVWERGILKHPLIQKQLPDGLEELGKFVRFEGHSAPSIPLPWRWAESISALKALEATLLNRLLQEKYSISPVPVVIDTSHATLFVFGTALAQVVLADDLSPSSALPLDPDYLIRCQPPPKDSQYRLLATNIYPTKDERFYHTHGSLDATATLTALGLPARTDPAESLEASIQRITARVLHYDSTALDELMNERYRQAGTIAWSSDEYFASYHGQANSKAGLYELHRDSSSCQAPSWWPESPSMPSSPQRPLAGLKVVDLTRVIAGPTITRSLAELGASVMRVTSPDLPDQVNVHRDLNWGKWNCYLNLKDVPEDKQTLRELVLDADVVVDGYRPGALEKLGFGREEVFELVRGRGRGIVHLRENCYGWHGPWSHRSGWQGISDAASMNREAEGICCGVSLAYGKAMGLDEPVTPPFPNSDHCTGTIGSAAVLHALVERAESGGCYGIDVALNYYSQWLVQTCGVYPPDVWADLWKRHGSPVFRHYDNTRKTVPEMVRLLRQYDGNTLLRPEFFHKVKSEAIGATITRVKPIAKFCDGVVQLKYNIGTRGNGVDKPHWPEDLGTEVIR